MTVVRIALAQLDPTVGDLDGNVAKLIDAYDRADAAGCDIVAYPELSITGLPARGPRAQAGFRGRQSRRPRALRGPHA